MNNNQIFKDNILIAKFMDNWTDNGLEPAYYVYNHKGYQSNELLFHSSWDWLMPVIDKIESIGETKDRKRRFEINSHNCQTAVFKPKFEVFIVGCYLKSPEKEKASSKIEAAYKVVIKFIKWYNKNEKISNSLW